MPSLKELIVKIGADTTGLTGGVNDAKNSLAGLKVAGEGLATIGTAIAAPIAAAGVGVLAAAGNFEAGMNKVSAISGATTAQLVAMRDQAKELGATTKFSASEAADGMSFLSMAGFKANETMAAMPGLLSLAAASGMELGAAADIASNILSGFGIEAAEAGRVADVLAQAAASSNTNVTQLGDAMKYVAPVAAAVGISVEEAAAAVGKLSDAGIQGEMAGTNLRGIIAALIDPAGEAADALGRLRITTHDAANQMLPLRDIMAQLKAAGADASDMFTIFGRLNASAAITLKESLPAYDDLVTKLKDSDGAAAKMAETMQQGLKGGLTSLSSAIEGLAIAIGDSGLLDWATGLVAAITDVVRAAASAPPGLLQFATAVTGAVGAVAALAAGVGGLMVAWGTLGPSITAAGSLMAAVATGPVGITVAAVAALTAAGYALADQLGVLDPIIAAIGSVLDTVGSAISAVVMNFQPLVAGIAAFAGELLTANPLVAALAGWIGEKLHWAMSELGGIIKTVVIVHLEALGAVFGWLSEKAKALFEYFVDKGKKSLGETGTAFKTTAAASESLLQELDAVTGSAKKTEPELKKTSASALVLGTNANKAKQDVFDLDKSLRALEATNREAKRIAEAAAKALAEEMSPAAVDLKVDVEAVSAATQVAMNNIAAWTRTAADGWNSAAMQAATKTAEIEAAFSAMGIKTKGELEQAAADAAHNFDLIAGSGQASADAIDAAWAQMLQARKEALIANGSDLGVEEQKILDDLLARQKGHATETKTVWQTWGDGLKDAANNLNLGDKIFSGAFAPDKWKSTLKGIGKDFLDAFVQPGIDAINRLVDKGIKILMDSLDGLIGKLGGVGGAFSSAFGGGVGGVTPGVGGSGGGGAAGAASGGGGGGALGIINAVTGGITAGSSVWGNFQNMEIETGIDAIEKETRETKLWIETNVVPALWQINEAVSWGAGVKAVEALLAHVSGPQFQILGGIMEATSWGPNVKANERTADEVSGLRSDIYMLMAKLDQIINRPISIQVDGRELALVVGENQEALGITA